MIPREVIGCSGCHKQIDECRCEPTREQQDRIDDERLKREAWRGVYVPGDRQEARGPEHD